jgi:tryptophan 2,3-dioxygenase
VAVIELFPAHIRVLETMSPKEFLKFRDNLMPASGLQSLQFRRVEFLLGMGDNRYAAMFNSEESAQLKRDSETNLWDTFLKAIKTKYDLNNSDKTSQMDSIKQIYNQDKFEDAKQFCENLIELDESLLKWRNAHALLAERMIGYKPGTGREDVQKITQKGSFEEGGVKYLRDMTMKKAFPLLWEARTYLT